MSDFGDAFIAGKEFQRLVNEDGEPVVILKQDEKAVTLASLIDTLDDHPRRKTGTVVVRRAESFTSYVNDHKSTSTRIFADQNKNLILAVLDHHSEQMPGWREHKIVLGVEMERVWSDWVTIDRKILGQEQFVEFLESHKRDIAAPDAAELIDVCTALKGKKGVEWASGIDLRTGAIQLAYQETLEATSARKGTLEVPAHLILGLKVYRGQAPYRVDADLRWRIVDGKLGFMIVLDGPEDILDSAFSDVVEGVGEATGIPVLYGTP